MQDAWRAYLEMALGATEASRKKATQVIRSLAEQSGARVEDLQGMAEELLTTGLANRESLVKLVRFELDRALGKVGLATNEEVAALNARVRELELELRKAREQADEAERAAAAAQASGGAARSVKKTAARKATKKSTAPVAKKVAKKATKKTAKKVAKKVAKKSTTKDSE